MSDPLPSQSLSCRHAPSAHSSFLVQCPELTQYCPWSCTASALLQAPVFHISSYISHKSSTYSLACTVMVLCYFLLYLMSLTFMLFGSLSQFALWTQSIPRITWPNASYLLYKTPPLKRKTNQLPLVKLLFPVFLHYAKQHLISIHK